VTNEISVLGTNEIGADSFSGSYDSVKRFIRRQQSSHFYPVRRLEKFPCEEAQIDFGSGAPVLGADVVKRKTWSGLF
jgi:hypothetical protein